MPHLDTAWQQWLTENINRGCTVESLVSAMTAAGFDATTASTLIQQYSSKNGGAQSQIATSEAYAYDAMPIEYANCIDADDRNIQVLMRCERPQVVIFGDVLSAEECDEIIERSRAKLKRSTTINPQTGQEFVIDRRTSEGAFFNRCEDDFITRIDRRVARLMNWPLECGEGLQILRYGVGGEYRPHFDYFPPVDTGSAAHIANGGQRVSTLIMYLNDVAAGGETIFPDASISVVPKKGAAVYFRYCNTQGQIDPRTLHGGNPVLEGEKWIMTKWMRQRKYG
ncbi:MAG TPA: 2OG-Fe(II) oxygenase [Rhodocyclaceae bacterium]|nr:2OG-Fe(II) oxygenase [Rhodocyclaceae bacterium]